MKRIYGKFLLIIILLLLITPSIIALKNQQSSLKPIGGEFRNIIGIVRKVRRHIDYVSFHAIFLIVWGAEAFEHSYMPYLYTISDEDYEVEKPLPGIIICNLLFFHYD